MWHACSPRALMSCCAPRSPTNVHEGLQAAATTDVHIFGRRGPAQTKFSPLEARELAHPQGLQVVMDPRDVEQITDAQWEAINADKRTAQVVQTFVGWLEEQQRREAAGEEPTDRERQSRAAVACTCTSGTVPSRSRRGREGHRHALRAHPPRRRGQPRGHRRDDRLRPRRRLPSRRLPRLRAARHPLRREVAA